MSNKNSIDSSNLLMQRIVLFAAGFCNFIIGYALYFIFKDDKSKDWQIEFIQRGAAFGLAFTIIGLIISLISIIIK